MSAEDLRLQLVRAIDANNEVTEGFEGVPPLVSYGAIDVVRNGSAFEVTLKDATFTDDYVSLYRSRQVGHLHSCSFDAGHPSDYRLG